MLLPLHLESDEEADGNEESFEVAVGCQESMEELMATTSINIHRAVNMQRFYFEMIVYSFEESFTYSKLSLN